MNVIHPLPKVDSVSTLESVTVKPVLKDALQSNLVGSNERLSTIVGVCCSFILATSVATSGFVLLMPNFINYSDQIIPSYIATFYGGLFTVGVWKYKGVEESDLLNAESALGNWKQITDINKRIFPELVFSQCNGFIWTSIVSSVLLVVFSLLGCVFSVQNPPVTSYILLVFSLACFGYQHLLRLWYNSTVTISQSLLDVSIYISSNAIEGKYDELIKSLDDHCKSCLNQ